MVTGLREWLAIALQRSVRVRAFRVAALVGTLLAIINHADAIISGPLPAAAWLKIVLTYLVPYGVSTYASVQAIRQLRADGERQPVAKYAAQQEC